MAPTTLELTPFGDGIGLVFPPELLAKLRLADGDVLRVTETRDGVVLTKAEPQDRESQQPNAY